MEQSIFITTFKGNTTLKNNLQNRSLLFTIYYIFFSVYIINKKINLFLLYSHATTKSCNNTYMQVMM